MARKKVFICFDYDNDRNYRYLLKALAENASSEIEFEDLTPEEIQSDDVGRIKAALRRRIRATTHTLVVIGKHANSYHSKRNEIGTRNWQWWEIEKSAEEIGRKFIGVKIEASNAAPEPLIGKGATWARSFKVESILKAINES
jgi:hypothetical protein